MNYILVEVDNRDEYYKITKKLSDMFYFCYIDNTPNPRLSHIAFWVDKDGLNLGHSLIDNYWGEGDNRNIMSLDKLIIEIEKLKIKHL